MCSLWVNTAYCCSGIRTRLEFARQVGEVGDFDAGDVVEIAGIVAVAADAIGHLADPAGDVVDDLVEALPLVGNAGAFVLVGAAFADTGDQQGLPVSKRGGLRLSSGVESMMIGS